jgi:hypothetical protein
VIHLVVQLAQNQATQLVAVSKRNNPGRGLWFYPGMFLKKWQMKPDLSPIFSKCQGYVMTTKPKGVRERHFYRHLSTLVGHIVKVAFRIGLL